LLARQGGQHCLWNLLQDDMYVYQPDMYVYRHDIDVHPHDVEQVNVSIHLTVSLIERGSLLFKTSTIILFRSIIL